MNEVNNSKSVTRKLNISNDNSKTNYGVGIEFTYNTEVLISNLCDYNDEYIIVKSIITVTAAPATQVALKKFEPFTKYIRKMEKQ